MGSHHSLISTCFMHVVYRGQDLTMLACFQSKERTEADWKHLICSADPRFVLKSVTHAQQGPLAVIEVVWDEFGPVREAGEASDESNMTGVDTVVHGPHAGPATVGSRETKVSYLPTEVYIK